MKNKKAFTLIELVSVLVILAILVLIVTPLVLNIIRKARIPADKRSIDAYGRSIELAVADYLLENGTFPTSIEELTIEYSGDRVTCITTQLNADSTIYLEDCKVGSRTVIGYTYGIDKSPTYDVYSVGDEITYNNVDYYVIKNSGVKDSTVTLLKKKPLTSSEINGLETNHINLYFTWDTEASDYQRSINFERYGIDQGYGKIAYYTSKECGYIFNGNTGTAEEYQYDYITTDCKNSYESSDIKYVVDAWALKNTLLDDLVQDSKGYKTRILSLDDLTDSLGMELNQANPTTFMVQSTDDSLDWIFSNNNKYYYCWTMTESQVEQGKVFYIAEKSMYTQRVNYGGYGVRPVITISKSALN